MRAVESTGRDTIRRHRTLLRPQSGAVSIAAMDDARARRIPDERQGAWHCRSRAAAGVLAVAAFASPTPADAAVEFAGYTWQVRNGTGGPGPNTFDAQNVSVDANGHLHLRIVKRNGKWTCAEVFLDQRFGFGTYQFQLLGRPDRMDDNVVLGLFNYTVPEVGPDATNEIDIEFATWGGAQAEHGNYTVWPAVDGLPPTSHPYDATLAGDASTHRFDWRSGTILFQSLDGWHDDDTGEYARWSYAPVDALQRIPQQPLPVHINLWLFQGKAPTDGQAVDVVVTDFRFVAAPLFGDGFE